MPSNIKFETATLGEILANRKNLAVPINQRSYAWKPEHVQDLLKDLNAALTKGADEYFLGAIIVLPNGAAVYVYDGQQRLATTTILIAAIRDYFFRKADAVTANQISNESLLTIDRRTHELRPHLKLNVDDHEFFENRILRAPDDVARLSCKPNSNKESHELIEAAAVATANHIAAITTTLPAIDAAQLLHKWLDYLLTGAKVIWVEVRDEQTAFRIFETMNDRGLKLSASDLVKNYVYAASGNRKSEAVQRWQSMTATLESLGREDGDVVDYIRYFWVTTHGPTRLNDLFDEIKSEATSEATTINFLTSLDLRVSDYAAILTPTHDFWSSYHQEVRSNIDTLRYLGVSQIRPLLLAAMGKFSKSELERLFKLAVSWSVRFLVVGTPSGTLEGYYSRTAKKITDGLITTVAGVTTELAAVLPPDDVFETAFSTISVAKASLARYYLRRLQIQADGNNEPQYTPNEGTAVTLEHILPQKPGLDWASIPVDLARAIYNRLGNQALLAGSINSSIGNVGFETKKAALAASPFSLTSSVSTEPEWNLTAISHRQTELAKLAVKAWSLL
jgi:hypothetical protein